MHWAGHHMVHRVDKPNGESIHYRYDREGNLVEVVNERGEVHTLKRDLAGRVIAETFFDGRTYDYKLDAAGRLAAHRNGAGERTEIARDTAGRVIERTYDDGSKESFEYDPEGRLVASSAGDVLTTYAYNARGVLVKETSSVAGAALSVECAVNAIGQTIERRSRAGSVVRFDRDLMGRTVRIHLPDGGVIERTLDGLGREVLRSLPEGGAILCRYDGMGAMIERRVVGGRASRRGTPDWVGRLPEGTTFAEGFVVSRGGELIERVTSDGEREAYAYDTVGRIVQRSTRTGVERFSYDGAGHTHEVDGPARAYGAGGVPLRRGEETYQYDAEARRVRKTDQAGRETRYEWNGRGLLAGVRLSDGTRVEYVYDTEGRRVLRRRSHPTGAVTETRFAWCQGLMFHETTLEISGGERRLVSERLYVHDDVGAPLAHRDTVYHDGQAVHQPWVHYVAGPADLPALLIAGDGAILSRVRSSAWGVVSFEGAATTPLRFLGQYFDEDTGLSYNRYRYYDPALGLFINADPSGLSGGTSAFEYARSQPYRYVDPLGLQPVTTTVTSSDGTITQTGYSTRHPNHTSPQGIHPVVWQALPQRGAFYNEPGPDGRGGIGQSYPAGRPPHTCGEPHALTNYIRAWEQQHNGGQPLNPNNPRDREKIQRCLGSIGSIASQHDDGTPRAPCPNCSQLIANLQARWGAPATSAVQPGYTNPQGTGPLTNYSPPLENYLGPRRRYR
ncbi:RHS repeat-associated core domain-containing protein [Sorangium sp. So ce1036]|uniref:RHS repeat-associated core domain-containing protein n=1 Tax=Sorangium sp. So ce1036 TaxID=3133328 RepID=UPI003F04997F